MARDKDFEILKEKYNLAITKAKDLKEQLDLKEEQWQERNEQFDIIEKNCRELCEKILAKDPNEMVLGTDYSWATTPVLELITKAKRVFAEYNASRTDIMRKIMDVAEERRNEIEVLKEEIMELKTKGGDATIYKEDVEETVKKLKERKEEEKRTKKAVKSMSPAIQQAYEEGDIELKTVKNAIKSGNAVVIEDDADIDFDDDEVTDEDVHIKSTEKALLQAAVEDGAMVRATHTSIPVSRTKKEITDKKELKKKMEGAFTEIAYNELVDKISENGWLIIKIIGDTGLSVAKDIYDKAMELYTMEDKKARKETTDLANISVLRKEKVITAKGNFFVFNLTSQGSVLYKKKYGKASSLSEADKMIKEHDNITHGYSIKYAAEAIIASKCFDTVEIWNRKNHRFDLEGGLYVVPDIYCEKGGASTLIEYELDHYSSKDFNQKCLKICKVTSKVCFVAPNQGTAEKIVEKMKIFLKKYENSSVLRHKTFRVTTYKGLIDTDINKDENWMYLYRTSKDKEFVKNF